MKKYSWQEILESEPIENFNVIMKKFTYMSSENALFFFLVYQDSKNIEQLKQKIKENPNSNNVFKYKNTIEHLKKEIISLEILKVMDKDLLEKITKKLVTKLKLSEYIKENTPYCFEFDFDNFRKDILKILSYDTLFRYTMQNLDKKYHEIRDDIMQIIENDKIFEKVDNPHIILPQKILNNKNQEYLNYEGIK